MLFFVECTFLTHTVVFVQLVTLTGAHCKALIQGFFRLFLCSFLMQDSGALEDTSDDQRAAHGMTRGLAPGIGFVGACKEASHAAMTPVHQ